MNFLEHEVAVLAFLGRVGRQFTVVRRTFGAVAVAIDDAHAAQCHFSDITLIEKHEATRDWQQGSDIRGHKVLARTKADDHRTTHACGDDACGALLADDRQGVGPFELRDRRTHGLIQIAKQCHMKMDAMGDDFSVGLGTEDIAGFAELGAQLFVVFNNAVVHDGQAIA